MTDLSNGARSLVLVGLTAATRRDLARGKMITIDLEPLLGINAVVWLFGGRDHAEILQWLQEAKEER